MSGKHLFEADVLRAIAIVLIVFNHAHYYFDYQTIPYMLANYVDFYIASFGLGLFFFISGYLLYHNHPKLISGQDILDFYKRRVLRIYPLYWVAFILAIFCFGYLHLYIYIPIDFSVGKIIATFLGMQSLIGDNPTTILFWFIGIIIIYYILYSVIVVLSKRIVDIVLVSLILCTIIWCIYFITRSIDVRLGLYFPVFVIGIIACRMKIFDSNRINKYIPILVAGILLWPFLLRFASYPQLIHVININNMVSMLVYLVGYIIFMVSLCFLLFLIVRKYGSLDISKKLLLPQISRGSYAAYLFDPICYGIVYAISQSFYVNGYLHDGAILIIASPMILAVGYLAQNIENNLRRFLNRHIFYDHRKTSGV